MIEQVTTNTPVISRRKSRIITLLSGILWCLDHWILIASLFLGIWIALPFLAPLFMRLGWLAPASLIYTIYGTQCHQMAQRSFFLFGPQPMYNLDQLPIALTGKTVSDMEALRAFIGNSEFGWKVAWSDRMVYMYGGLWLAAILYGLLKKRRVIRPLSVIGFVLLLFPMAIDGGTHLISDLAGGLTGGFRYENQWLANLTGNALPTWFYVGDALGSFNSWMRLISGLAFGFALIWLAFPYLDRPMRETAEELRAKLARAQQPKI